MEQIWVLKKELKKKFPDLPTLLDRDKASSLEKIINHSYLVEKFSNSTNKKEFSLTLEKIDQELNKRPIDAGIIEESMRLAYSQIIRSVIVPSALDELDEIINSDLKQALPSIISKPFENLGCSGWKYDAFFKQCRKYLKIESSSETLFYYILDKIKKNDANSIKDFVNSRLFPFFFSYLYGDSKKCKKIYYLKKFLSFSHPRQPINFNIEMIQKRPEKRILKSCSAEFKSAVLTLGNSEEFDIDFSRIFNLDQLYSCLLLVKNNLLIVLNFLSKVEILVKLQPKVEYLIHKGDLFKFGQFYIKVLNIQYSVENDLRSFMLLEMREKDNVLKTIKVESEVFCFGVSTGGAQVDEVVASNKSVSKKHFCVCFHDGKWFIKDLESRNGTYYIPQSVKNLHFSSPFELHPGRFTLIELANTNFIIRLVYQ